MEQGVHSVSIMVGAEGGFEEEEVQQAQTLCVELTEEKDYEKRIKAFAEIGVTAAKRQGIKILAEDEVLE